jgi:hypothetical protein
VPAVHKRSFFAHPLRFTAAAKRVPAGETLLVATAEAAKTVPCCAKLLFSSADWYHPLWLAVRESLRICATAIEMNNQFFPDGRAGG